ncbi:hypothetical protein [Undibacterium luofuense]|uniref:hypothetical protein n=1 Tax=Undibacterium luofuense TaxID=2828733 RepID=UPI0030EE12C8
MALGLGWKKSWLAGLALLAGHVAAQTVSGAPLTIQIIYRDAQQLEVSYAPQQACQRLRLSKENRDGEGLRDGWQALNDCARLEGDQIVWKQAANAANCVARFAVPVTKKVYHHYQPALPLGQAVLLHTSNYAVDHACGDTRYVLSAPAVATGGQAVPAQLVLDTGVKERDSQPALLLPDAAVRFEGTPFYADPDVPQTTVALIRDVADHTVQYLREQLPSVPFRMPMIAAASIRDGGPTYFNGNAQEILQLAFFNWPLTMDDGGQRTVSQFVAHEFSHRFQMYPAGVASYAEERLIHEGGAEFLRWMTSIKTGWLSPQQAAADVDNALAKCLISAGQRSLRSLSRAEVDNGRIGYVCGLPAYVYAIAGSTEITPALKRLDNYYRQLQQSGSADFATMLECDGKAGCQPRWLPQLLRSEQTISAVWQHWLSSSALAVSSKPTPDQQQEMLISAIGQLMREDCSGMRDVYPQKDKIVLSGLPQCQRLRAEVSVTQIEGLPYSGDQRTLPAMVSACRERQEVRLGLEQGQTLTLACRKPVEAISQFHQAKIAEIIRQLQP